MSNAVVYINGGKVKNWLYGYNSFHCDIAEFVEEGKENVLAMRLENFLQFSCWYPGASIYRNVHTSI